jgi:hypothetical protein
MVFDLQLNCKFVPFCNIYGKISDFKILGLSLYFGAKSSCYYAFPYIQNPFPYLKHQRCYIHSFWFGGRF